MKIKKILCVLLFLLLLSGCANESTLFITINSYDGTNAGISAVVDVSAKTITIGEDVYTYEKRSDYISVVCPNGAKYTKEKSKSEEVWFNSTSGTEDTEKYLSRSDLFEILDRVPEEKGINWFSVFVIFVGILMVIYPKLFWFMRYGMYFKEAEMSTAAGMIFRGIGVIIIVLGIYIL